LFFKLHEEKRLEFNFIARSEKFLRNLVTGELMPAASGSSMAAIGFGDGLKFF
jgi:hypothetical protein